MNKQIIDAILSAAIKAPSGHNTQPWLFCPCAGGIRVLPDASRRLPRLDPTDRELYISMGCAVENMCIAATQYHLAANAEVDGDGSVRVLFAEAGRVEESSLASVIPLRHTNRNTFDGSGVPGDVIDALSGCVTLLCNNGTPQFDIIADGIREANKVIYGNRQMVSELKEWLRYNRQESEAGADGLGHDVMGLPDMPSWISRAITSVALNAGVQTRSDIKKLYSSPAVAVFSSADDINGRIDCGRRLQRFLLTATLHDVACAFIGQPCEVEWVAAKLAMSLGLPERLQLLVRIGHAAPPAAYSRRRPLGDFWQEGDS